MYWFSFALTLPSPPTNSGCLKLSIELTPETIVFVTRRSKPKYLLRSQELFTMRKTSLHHLLTAVGFIERKNPASNGPIYLFFELLLIKRWSYHPKYRGIQTVITN